MANPSIFQLNNVGEDDFDRAAKPPMVKGASDDLEFVNIDLILHGS